MNLRSIDLNLLVVLQQLLLERHVSRAAEQLSMSQPAVSRALQRLRQSFSDPLLVRTPAGYDLSARAATLLPELNQLLENTKRLIQGPSFDPTSSTQTIRFYGPDPEISWFLPRLLERLRAQAPHMKLDARSDPMDHFALLASGDVHFVFSALRPDANTDQLRGMKLETLHFALMMRSDNPLAKGRLTMKRYLAASQGLVTLTGRGSSLLEEGLIAKGHLASGEHLDIPLRLTSFTSVAAFCERSDIVFHLPRRFVLEMIKGRSLISRDPPPGMREEPVTVYLYWHERHHNDPMCIWVREQFKQILSSH